MEGSLPNVPNLQMPLAAFASEVVLSTADVVHQKLLMPLCLLNHRPLTPASTKALCDAHPLLADSSRTSLATPLTLATARLRIRVAKAWLPA